MNNLKVLHFLFLGNEMASTVFINNPGRLFGDAFEVRVIPCVDPHDISLLDELRNSDSDSCFQCGGFIAG
jgi:hypothetical protein